MNPALQNYLQNTQNQQPSQGQQSQPYNPFDAGIQKAISSARASLAMTKEQEENAFNNALLTFGDAIAQSPREKGFLNNFASAGRALSPALRSYDESENAALGQNQALANEILKQNALEQQRQVEAEERAWRRQLAERQLGEQSRYHDLMYGNNGAENTQASSIPFGSDLIPIESKAERLLYSKDKKASGEILKELSDIKKDYEKFKGLAEQDFIHPMTPYGIGNAANSAKDLWGYFTKNQNLREETSKRKALEAKLGKFAVELERKLKGGVLSEGMVKRFENKGLLPSLADAPDVFEGKLNNLMEEMSDRYKASNASLKYGIHLSPYDLDKLENSNPQQNVMTPETSITPDPSWPIIVNPETGEEAPLRPDALEEALKRGFKIKGQND